MPELKKPVATHSRCGGDLGTGVALRLHRAGWRVLITELLQPLVIRRTVALAVGHLRRLDRGRRHDRGDGLQRRLPRPIGCGVPIGFRCSSIPIERRRPSFIRSR